MLFCLEHTRISGPTNEEKDVSLHTAYTAFCFCRNSDVFAFQKDVKKWMALNKVAMKDLSWGHGSDDGPDVRKGK